MITRRRALQFATSVFAPAVMTRTARAQAWPNRSVRIIVPFPPGGGGDTIARIVGAKLTEIWGQQIIVENKGGAGGNIASDATARSAPDGYTLFLARRIPRHQPVHLSEALLRPGDRLRSGLAGRALSGRPGGSELLAGQNLREFVALAKASSSPADLCVAGIRNLAASRGRAVETRSQHRADARALSRRCAGDPGSDPRPRRLFLQQYRADRAADEGAPVAWHRGHQREARACDARPPDSG